MKNIVKLKKNVVIIYFNHLKILSHLQDPQANRNARTVKTPQKDLGIF